MTSLLNKEPNIIYKTFNYPKNHWSVSYSTDFHLLNLCYKSKYYYQIFLNPTDSRYYRLIIRIITNTNNYNKKLLLLNRKYNEIEIQGLYFILSKLDYYFLNNYQIIVQSVVLENNS